MFKKPVIPYKENVDSPDLPTVICLFICMFCMLVFIQHFHKKLCIKEFFCRIRKKHFFYPIVIRIFFEPYPDRNRESQFLLLCSLTADHLFCRPAKIEAASPFSQCELAKNSDSAAVKALSSRQLSPTKQRSTIEPLSIRAFSAAMKS